MASNLPLKIALLGSLLLGWISPILAQEPPLTDREKDSLYIERFEEGEGPVKVLHAEPLYIDLIRDLGARKGEKEWNLGLEITDNLDFDTYGALIEYEFAPINRLGFEIEFPFLFYQGRSGVPSDSIPSDELESLKLATQWSFFVHEKWATSMALGYINELEFTEFRNFGNPLFKANIYNPFLIVAKRWGENYHTLIYTGPQIEQSFPDNDFHTVYELNANLHYMVPGTRNFMGFEFNMEFDDGDFDMVIRPQMRIEIKGDLMIGIVAGIPVSRENERLSAFTRIIWEPGSWVTPYEE
ncbi:HAEPLYID family protein [Pontibacter sp. G13]|uniref:HAEPLYID family protein n=1 Tax=Pontibacter sp. G13 TaxID=3074898 RepID=UPI0028893E33|nr:HAEPLYID family protein [Pontibacter sp. G13]WNJ20690.1 HAEPLYID family protein [Pontibacter sp. G13]